MRRSPGAVLAAILILYGSSFVLSQWQGQPTQPSLSRVNGWFTDAKFRLRGPSAPRSRVVLVSIDDTSLQRLGSRWPWPRDRLAYLLLTILKSQPQAVVVDVLFPENELRLSEEMEARLERLGLLKMASEFSSDSRLAQVISAAPRRIVLSWAGAQVCSASQGGCLSEISDEPPLSRTMDRFGYGITVPPTALAARRSSLPSLVHPLPNIDPFNAAAEHQGIANSVADFDGVHRSAPLVFRVGNQLHPSSGAALAQLIRGDRLVPLLDLRGDVTSMSWEKSGESVPIDRQGRIRVNWRGPGHAFRHLSAAGVLSGEQSVPAGSAVVLAVTALAAGDRHPTPLDMDMSGGEALATVVDNLVTGDPIRVPNRGIHTVLLLFTMLVFGGAFALAMSKLEARPGLLLATGALALALALDLFLFSRFRLDLPLGYLHLQLATLAIASLGMRYLEEERNRKYLRAAFSRYVSPAFVDLIARDPRKLQLGGQKKNLTVLFADIRGFTSWSEQVDARVLAEFLNDYLDLMTDIVFETEGTLDKYIGDAVMAFWGAPVEIGHPAAQACLAATRMIRTLDAHRPRLKQKYGIDVNVGVGVNSGPVSVGNMGSSRSLGFTVLGDPVNLASRLEGATKHFGVSILTTRATLDEIAREGQPLPRHRVLDLLKVKGKKIGVEVIQLLDRELDPEGLELFAQGRERYRLGDWDQAERLFEKANARLRRGPGDDDGPCVVFIERCRTLRDSPPADWDGSWQLESK